MKGYTTTAWLPDTFILSQVINCNFYLKMWVYIVFYAYMYKCTQANINITRLEF